MARAAYDRLRLSRRAFGAGLGLCCLPKIAGATSDQPMRCDEVASNIFIRRGPDQDATAENSDAIANIGFAIGENSVAVLDPGGSLADGARLRAAIREKTAKKISHVVMSHPHPDHVFGAGAFVEDAPIFVGHARLPKVLAARGEFYRKRLVEILGEAATGPLILPTETVETATNIDLGGCILRLKSHPLAHSGADLSVLDLQSGHFLPSDLVFVGRVPSLDGRLSGWLAELDTMAHENFSAVTPGHGPTRVALDAALPPLRGYLLDLRAQVAAALDADQPLDRLLAAAQRQRDPAWTLFDDYHPHNVAQAFHELEWGEDRK